MPDVLRLRGRSKQCTDHDSEQRVPIIYQHMANPFRGTVILKFRIRASLRQILVYTRSHINMATSTLAQEKDLEVPTGHPAFDEPATPLAAPPLRTSPIRYYQRFPPDLDAAPSSAGSGDREFDVRSEEPRLVKAEATVLERVRGVLRLHRRC